MTENSLMLLSNATKMLAEVKTIDDAKNLMDIAASAKYYAKKLDLGKDAVGYARSIEISAEIKLGEFLKEMEKNKGGNPNLQLVENDDQLVNLPPTLKEIGISKDLSAEAQVLAGLPIEEQEKVKSGKTSKQAAKRKQKKKEDSEAIESKTFPVIEGKIKTILLDPPCDDGSLSLAGRGHPEYATMGVDELQALNIGKYAEENCHLYLWTTNNFLHEALKLGTGWGFSYKTVITWIKPSMGMGSYFRNSTEQLLFFVKGILQTRTNNTITHFEAPRGKHSEKPEISYKIIEANSYPAYLEYFSRRKRENWTVFGNVQG
jgi:N6-adenosine-specific RNA methylase IME4